VKKFILCADGFGKSKDHNRAVLNGSNSGFIKSASIVANGEAFDTAINDIIPECPNISVGINLNITDGASLTPCFKLVDINHKFKHNFYSLLGLIKQDKTALEEIETEFRAQIEKIISYTKVFHVNSAANVHLIPEVFSITCKLAKEYNISYIRTHNEELYYVPDFKHIINLKYFAGIYKILKYNKYYREDKVITKEYGLKTSDYSIGTAYKSFMDSKSLEYGLKTLSDEDNILVECSIEPCSYLRNINNPRSLEFKMSQDRFLEDTVSRLGYEITNHKNI